MQINGKMIVYLSTLFILSWVFKCEVIFRPKLWASKSLPFHWTLGFSLKTLIGALSVGMNHYIENHFKWNQKDQYYQGTLASNYRHSINMYTAFLKNCEMLNEARQNKIV